MNRRARPAFTLLELLLAMALNLVLLGAIATATFVFLRGFQSADRDVVEAQLARVIFSRLAQDLRELCDHPPPTAEDRSATERALNGDLPPAVLRGTVRDLQLLVRDEQPLERGAQLASEDQGEPPPPAWQIDYKLADAASDSSFDASPPAQGLLRERRRMAAADASEPGAHLVKPSEVNALELGAAALAPSSRDRLQVEEVADLRLRYYDGAEWRDDWDSQLDGLPRAIEAVLLLRRPARDAVEPAALPLDEGLALPPGGYRLVIAMHKSMPSPSVEDEP